MCVVLLFTQAALLPLLTKVPGCLLKSSDAAASVNVNGRTKLGTFDVLMMVSVNVSLVPPTPSRGVTCGLRKAKLQGDTPAAAPARANAEPIRARRGACSSVAACARPCCGPGAGVTVLVTVTVEVRVAVLVTVDGGAVLVTVTVDGGAVRVTVTVDAGAVLVTEAVDVTVAVVEVVVV